VREFLPKLASANKELEEKMKTDPSFIPDIEHIADENQQHIEMVTYIVFPYLRYSEPH